MKTFEELQNIWEQQTESDTKPTATEIIKKAEANTKKIKRSHFWTKVILSLTSLILIAYYIWVGAYKQTLFSFGLCIMITMLIARIALEWSSAKKLENLKTDVNLIEYSKLAHQFYDWRKKIHYIFTPIIYITYIVGFTLLLPVFKDNFSRGFYLYILISGYAFLLIFGFFMIRIIKKEIKLLNFLKDIS
ncbi:hypothetical protein RB619_17775 [Flavobacterium sp. LHD-80]|uniref:hypothetical protein n=1 Tax=Flavobacterium sp. LHD-80 TaxID=3071411 RepID=UPI0027E1C91E|nr:hypothetical protein [Flavobacterium sp. LHD-80]MDQ6472494.1 hypothetical protein [Flavobacterium sp. LHD-80]